MEVFYRTSLGGLKPSDRSRSSPRRSCHRSPLAVTLHTLATVYQQLRLPEKADPLYQEALALWEKAPAKGRPGAASTLQNLGYLRFEQGRWEEAEELFGRALALHVSIYGTSGLRTADSLAQLGELYLCWGQLPKAKSLLLRAVPIQRSLPPGTPERVAGIVTLAQTYTVEGSYPEALTLLRQAESEARVHDTSWLYANVLANLGDLYRLMHQNARALPLLTRALWIYESSGAVDHPDIPPVLTSLAAIDVSEHRSIQARKRLERAVAILEKHYGPDHPAVAPANTQLARAYLEEGRYRESEQILNRIIPVQEKAYPNGYRDLAAARLTLARALARQGKERAAEENFRQALTMLEKLPQRDRGELIFALKAYSHLIERTRPGEAKALERRARQLMAFRE